MTYGTDKNYYNCVHDLKKLAAKTHEKLKLFLQIIIWLHHQVKKMQFKDS
jgi:hypothetical protein